MQEQNKTSSIQNCGDWKLFYTYLERYKLYFVHIFFCSRFYTCSLFQLFSKMQLNKLFIFGKNAENYTELLQSAKIWSFYLKLERHMLPDFCCLAASYKSSAEINFAIIFSFISYPSNTLYPII